ncbi:MAG: phosphoglucosamine mutase [Pyrinomonadaceae bacterium]
MKRLFGTDGMRGKAGQFPLDEATVFVVGQSLARQFNEKNKRTSKFIIGRDTRESGSWIESAVCAGARNAGAECISAGVMTTPGVAFLTKDLAADAGIVISASHNPFYDNGIKIFLPSGRKMDEVTERNIEADISDFKSLTPNFKLNSDANLISGNLNLELQERYLSYLADEFSNLSLGNLKMVVDCANGAASTLAPQLFERFGARVVVIFNQPDGRNINNDCGSLHIEKMRATVLAEKADLGVAFDGDADRALFVDADGNLVDGDATLWAMAQQMQNDGTLEKDTVVATSMSNLGLEIALKTRNIKLVRTDVGDKYVLEELLKSKLALGGEQSGHVIFPQRSLVGDGMLTTLALLEAMQERGAKLSDLITGFVRFPQILLNVRVREKRDLESVPRIATVIKAVEQELGEKGRLVLRYSGTEPLARVMIEGESQAVIFEQATRIAAIIEQELSNSETVV